jgi:5-formyltetrahydrofolate cyclo-ligase
MKKDELRKTYLAKRKALSISKRSQLSQQLCDQFFNTVDLARVNILHIYLPIESKCEPDTWLILNRIRKEFPTIRISIPKVKGDKIESIYFEDLEQLEKVQWDILEPHQGELTANEKIDLVIVPLLAFDTQGHRIGYGKGFYDRFLKECRPDCKKVGLSLFEPVDAIEFNQNDVLLSLCITPSKVYNF